MPHIKSWFGGTRAPAMDGSGEYEWPHPGAVVEVDDDTATELVRMAQFHEVTPEHADEQRVDPPSDGAGETDDEPNDDAEGDNGDSEADAGTRRSRRRTRTVRE